MTSAPEGKKVQDAVEISNKDRLAGVDFLRLGRVVGLVADCEQASPTQRPESRGVVGNIWWPQESFPPEDPDETAQRRVSETGLEQARREGKRQGWRT